MALDASNVAFAQSELFDGIRDAERALHCGVVSGHARTKAGAIANLGLLSLYAGDLPKAEEYLRKGLHLASNMHELRLPLLDSYAQLRLVKGELEECESLLKEIDAAIPHNRSFRPSWYHSVTYPTRIRLLHRQLRWQEGLRLAEEGIELAAGRSHGLLGPLLRALKTHAFIALGRLDDATIVIADAAETSDGSTLAASAEVEQLNGEVSASQGKYQVARHHFERALRIVTAVGNACPRIDVTRGYLEMLGRVGLGTEAPPHPRQVGISELGEKPNAIKYCDSAVSHLGSTESEPPRPGLDDVSTLLDFAGHPELFAREAFALLRDARCTQAMALIASRNGYPLEVLEYFGWSGPQVRAVAHSTEPSDRLALGECRGRKFYLLIEAADDLESRAAVVAMRKLVKSALALETLRKDENQRASLWPLAAPRKDDGVYVADKTIEILTTARQSASSDLPVLITGETGTGKELLARAIHEHSKRADQPFIPYNCKGVARDMLDSQLFGHRRGSFTGAQEHFSGVIRAAEGGTLLLDEIGELDLDVQPKLLRFLDTGEIHPLGEAKPIGVDVRVIAATNANIDQLVSEGRFREDLFYRLNVIHFRMPPLRERREEIPPLIHHFLRRYGEEQEKRHLTLPDETLEYLLLYGWPGNVRQLANEIRRMVALSDPGTTLTPEQLSREIRAARRTVPAPGETTASEVPKPGEVPVRMDQPLASAVEQIERAMIRHALKTCAGRVEPAARMLGLSRKGLFLKRRRYGLDDLAVA